MGGGGVRELFCPPNQLRNYPLQPSFAEQSFATTNTPTTHSTFARLIAWAFLLLKPKINWNKLCSLCEPRNRKRRWPQEMSCNCKWRVPAAFPFLAETGKEKKAVNNLVLLHHQLLMHISIVPCNQLKQIYSLFMNQPKSLARFTRKHKKVVQSDGGKKYINGVLPQFLAQCLCLSRKIHLWQYLNTSLLIVFLLNAISHLNSPPPPKKNNQSQGDVWPAHAPKPEQKNFLSKNEAEQTKWVNSAQTIVSCFVQIISHLIKS